MQNLQTPTPLNFKPTTLDNVAITFWQNYYQQNPIDGGLAYESKLRVCVLDESLDSLKRLDQLLTAVAHDLSQQAYQEKMVLKQPAFRNFLLFVMFYVGRVVSRLLDEPISWQPIENLAQYYPGAAFYAGDNKFYHFAALFPQSFLINTMIPPLFVLLSLGAKLFGGFNRQFIVPITGEMVNDSLYWAAVDYLKEVRAIKDSATTRQKSPEMQMLDDLFEQILDMPNEPIQPLDNPITQRMGNDIIQEKTQDDKGRFATGGGASPMMVMPNLTSTTKPKQSPITNNQPLVNQDLGLQVLENNQKQPSQPAKKNPLDNAVKLGQIKKDTPKVSPSSLSQPISPPPVKTPATQPLPVASPQALPKQNTSTPPVSLKPSGSPIIPPKPTMQTKPKPVQPPVSPAAAQTVMHKPKVGATIGEPSKEPMANRLLKSYPSIDTLPDIPIIPTKPKPPSLVKSADTTKSISQDNLDKIGVSQPLPKRPPQAKDKFKRPAQDNMFNEIQYDLLVLPAANAAHQDDYKKAVAVLNKFDEMVVQKLSEGGGELVFNDKQVEVLTKAVKVMQKIANAGNTNAMLSLSLCYFKGVGVPQDFEKAASWVQRAADVQDIRAQKFLSRLYYQGLGVAQAVKMGDLWLSRAAANGHPEAQKLQSQFNQVKNTQDDIKTEAKKDKKYIMIIGGGLILVFVVFWLMLKVTV